MTDLPTGTVTFLFTDLEGSTRLWEEHPEAMRDALARHDEILRDAVEKRDGHVVKTTGDGLHAAFAVAPDAVAAALDAQRQLLAEPWTLPEPLRVRMGLHTGVAEIRDGDYFGTSVNRAARVAAAAHGGQVVASAASADLVRDDIGTDITLTDLGEHRLRDLGRPERIVQVTHPDLPSDFPPLRSLDAYPGNLPVQRTAFVGRTDDLAEVRASLDTAPVVTLTGVGGVGKTRLALQVAADAVGRFPDGAWLVDLGPVADDDFVAAVFSSSLGLPERRHGTIEESIVAALRDRRLLVVLDNCEHVIDVVADLVDRIVESCPGVRVLATSREALGVDGEDTYEVRPFAAPPSNALEAHAAMDNDAVRLFAERGRSAKRGFTISPENAPVVAEICERLDGIPLAIELAAARLKLMSPAEVLARLDERFQLLAGSRRTALERHQTLRGAIDWSYALLEPAEQLVFARLSVFAGGFTLDAAEAVAGDDDVVAAADVLGLLASLVAKSMVTTDDADTGTRYRLLDTLREYAAERLAELDDRALACAAHAAHYLAFVETAALELEGANDEQWLVKLMAEEDNLRAALTWARDQGESETLVRLAHALAPYWYMFSNFRDPLVWHQAALLHEEAMTPSTRAELLAYLGIATNALGGADDAIALYERSLDCSRQAGGPLEPRALAQLGIVALEANRPDEAIAHCEAALTAARACGSRWIELDALYMVVLVYNLAGDVERGRLAADELLAGARRLGNHFLISAGLFSSGIARVFSDPEVALELFDEADRTALFRIQSFNTRGQIRLFRGVAHLRLGQPVEAGRALQESLALMVETGSDYFVSTVIGTAASLLARSDPAAASTLLASLERFRSITGIAGAPPDVAQQRRVRARLEARMDVDEFAEAWARGADLDIAEAAAFTSAALERFGS